MDIFGGIFLEEFRIWADYFWLHVLEDLFWRILGIYYFWMKIFRIEIFSSLDLDFSRAQQTMPVIRGVKTPSRVRCFFCAWDSWNPLFLAIPESRKSEGVPDSESARGVLSRASLIFGFGWFPDHFGFGVNSPASRTL